MILQCPSCHARFIVADALIPVAGRTVKCGACAHQWHVEREEAAAAVEPTEAPAFADFLEAVPSGNVPAVTRRRLPAKPFKIAAPVLALAWLILAMVAYYPHWLNAPVFSGLYRTVGAQRTDGLVFADVHMEKLQEEMGKTQYILTGSIVNHAADTRTVPTVRVKLKNKDNETVWSREYAVNAELKAGEVYPFRITNVETSFASSVATIVLDVGHSLQLIMRG